MRSGPCASQMSVPQCRREIRLPVRSAFSLPVAGRWCGAVPTRRVLRRSRATKTTSKNLKHLNAVERHSPCLTGLGWTAPICPMGAPQMLWSTPVQISTFLQGRQQWITADGYPRAPTAIIGYQRVQARTSVNRRGGQISISQGARFR
jgi:hypothetical protein